MRRTDTIKMGDADQHREVGVELFLKRGAWQAWPPSDTWLQATPGWACASWRCARASHRARPLLLVCGTVGATGRQQIDWFALLQSGQLPAKADLLA
jgi:hypothetical protein